MQRKTVFSILLLLYLNLLLVDGQDKGDNDTSSTSGSSDDDDNSSDDTPPPQGPGDITIKGIVLNDEDQQELDLQQQEPQGEVITPSGDVWEPPAKDDTDD